MPPSASRFRWARQALTTRTPTCGLVLPTLRLSQAPVAPWSSGTGAGWRGRGRDLGDDLLGWLCYGAPAGDVLVRLVQAAAPLGHHRDHVVEPELLQGQVGGDVPHGPARAQRRPPPLLVGQFAEQAGQAAPL